MNKLFFLSLLLLFATSSLEAKQTYSYYTYSKKDHRTLSESSIQFNYPDDNFIQVYFAKQEGSRSQTEDYTFNDNYETINWSVLNEREATDYTGERKNNWLFIKGKFKGKNVDKKLKIDDNPFFAFPKFELTPFVLSNDNELIFWALHRDKLKIFKMIATKQGEETIQVGDKSILTIKVFWTTTSPIFRLFHRTYFFRASDGLFVKQEYSDGRIRELILEE